MAFDKDYGTFTDTSGSMHQPSRLAGTHSDTWRCQGCTLRGQHKSFGDPGALASHLDEHVRRGHKVPDSIIGELRQEAADRS